MAKKKRPGLKSPQSIRSGGGSVASGFSGTGGMSTRSGLGGSTSHDNKSVKSGRSLKSGGGASVVSGGGSGDDWDDATSKRSALMGKTGESMRSFLKTANSVSSGLSGHSTHKLTHKQKKARPGLAIAPQGMSTRSGHLNRGLSTRSGMSTRSGGSGHRSVGGVSTRSGKKGRADADDDEPSQRSMKKQLSLRSLKSSRSGSLRSLKNANNTKSTRSGLGGSSSHLGGGRTTSPKSSRHLSSSAPEPPPDDNNDGEFYDDDDGDYYSEQEYMEGDDDEYEEQMAMMEDEIVMPQTEEEIRKGLHTEQVTKGFFRKKVRSIKWYSADIDKVDAGDYQPGETIKEHDEEESEYETDSDDDSQEQVIPDPWYIALGRGLLLLEKKGEETTPIKRWLRFLTWLTFTCDATAAIVSLIQFSGVQTCCEQPILNLGGININWPVVIRYATIFYLILILLEVYPVLRRGFPFNIVNPIIGFLISFALFFDDSYREALIMWCIETCAVLSEFSVYRVKIRQVNMRAVEIKNLMPKTTKKKEAFEDEDTYLKELHKARRRYYVLKQEQRMDQRLLQYLHLAVYMNICMSSIVLMLILVIARNGGLCIVDFDYPNPFTSNQLGRCFHCTDPTLSCQYCDSITETYQCYFPYN